MRGNIRGNNPILDEGYTYDDAEDCLNTQIALMSVSMANIGRYQGTFLVTLFTLKVYSIY